MNIAQMRKNELEEKIEDLEESLVLLKQQLKQQEEILQHEAIDNLEFYLEQVDNKYENFRLFRSIMADELREFFGKSAHIDSSERS